MDPHWLTTADAATYQHPLLGTRPVDLDEAVKLLNKVTASFREVIEALDEYDDENPEAWASCSTHPEGDCGYRDLPGFYSLAMMSQCEVRDAEAFLKAVES
jgi:hypothetical protein